MAKNGVKGNQKNDEPVVKVPKFDNFAIKNYTDKKYLQNITATITHVAQQTNEYIMSKAIKNNDKFV